LNGGLAAPTTQNKIVCRKRPPIGGKGPKRNIKKRASEVWKKKTYPALEKSGKRKGRPPHCHLTSTTSDADKKRKPNGKKKKSTLIVEGEGIGLSRSALKRVETPLPKGEKKKIRGQRKERPEPILQRKEKKKNHKKKKRESKKKKGASRGGSHICTPAHHRGGESKKKGEKFSFLKGYTRGK